MFEWHRQSYSLENASIASVDKTPPSKSKRTKFRPFLGFLYTVLTSTFITLSSVIVKKLTYIAPGELSMVRNFGVLVGCLPILARTPGHPLGPRPQWPSLAFRSFLGATALYLNLLSFRYLPLAVASIIMSAVPAVVMVMARFYLHEPCGVVQGAAIMLTFCGVLMSIDLPDLLSGHSVAQQDPDYVMGLCVCVAHVIVLAAAFVALRKMRDVHFSIVMLYSGVIGVAENSTLTYMMERFDLPASRWDAVQMMLVGVLGFVGQSCMTLAIQTEAVSIVTMLKSSTDIIVALVFQWLFFQRLPDLNSLVGACLVIVSVTMIGLRKWLLGLPEDSSHRKKLRCLLL